MMKQMMKRLTALVMILLLVYSTAVAETTEKDGFHFDEKGFLTGDNPAEEYLLEDEK